MVLQPEDTPLSANGFLQADLLGERIRAYLASTGKRVVGILTSDLTRTRQTTEAIRRAIDFPAEAVVHHEILRERNFGDYRGIPYKELVEKNIDLFHETTHIPNGERWDEFHARCRGAWEFVRSHARGREGDEVLIVVSHGLVLYSFATRFWNVSSKGLSFQNTSVSVVETDREAEKMDIKLLNCDKHLEGGSEGEDRGTTEEARRAKSATKLSTGGSRY